MSSKIFKLVRCLNFFTIAGLMNQTATILILLLSITLYTSADKVILTTGRVIDGEVRDIGDKIEVKTDSNTYTFLKSVVRDIIKSNIAITNNSQQYQSTQSNDETSNKSANQYYQQAIQEIDKLNPFKAIEYLQKTIEIDKTHTDSYNQIVKLNIQMFKFDEAKKYLEKFAEVAPSDSRIPELEKQLISQSQKNNSGASSQVTITPIVIEKPISVDYTGLYALSIFSLVELEQEKSSITVTFYDYKDGITESKILASIQGNQIVPTTTQDTSLSDMPFVATFSDNKSDFNLTIRNTVLEDFGYRVLDRNVLEAFKSELNKDFAGATDIYRLALEKNQSDVFSKYHLLRCLIFSKNITEAEKVLNQLKTDVSLSKLLIMPKIISICENSISALKESEKGLNAIDDYEAAVKLMPDETSEIPSEILDITESKATITKENYENARIVVAPYTNALDAIANAYTKNFSQFILTGSPYDPQSNFVKYQVLARMLILQSKIKLYEENFADCVKMTRKVVKMGQHLNTGPLFSRSVSFSIMKIGLDSFEYLITNTLNNIPDAKHTLQLLKALIRDQKEINNEIYSYEFTEYPDIYSPKNADAILIKGQVIVATLNIMEVAAAAKLYDLLNGKYPTSMDMLSTDYFETQPIDVFSGEQIKLIGDINQITIYSAGPDRQDNKCQIIYDVRNGVNSPGDIIITLK